MSPNACHVVHAATVPSPLSLQANGTCQTRAVAESVVAPNVVPGEGPILCTRRLFQPTALGKIAKRKPFCPEACMFETSWTAASIGPSDSWLAQAASESRRFSYRSSFAGGKDLCSQLRGQQTFALSHKLASCGHACKPRRKLR